MTDHSIPQPAVKPRLSQGEFIALIAMLFATIAFSIDSMLPALPADRGELTPDNANAAQLIITSFVLGMGVGTFFAGPLSDAFGRKPVIIGGAVLYASVLPPPGLRRRWKCCCWPASCRASVWRPRASSRSRWCATCSRGARWRGSSASR